MVSLVTGSNPMRSSVRTSDIPEPDGMKPVFRKRMSNHNKQTGSYLLTSYCAAPVPSPGSYPSFAGLISQPRSCRVPGAVGMSTAKWRVGIAL